MFDKTYIDLCLDGEALLSDIDEFVARWHNSEMDISLQSFLGMKEDEYNAWMVDASMLPYIIKAHKEKCNLNDIYVDPDVKIAARGANAEIVQDLLEWLKKNEQ